MKKVVFVIPCLSGGGAERVVSVLANNMYKKGYNVSIVCLLKEEQTYFIESGIDVIFIKSYTKCRIKRNVEKFIKFVNVLKRIKPDITISFTYDCSMITAVATRFIDTKLIISERNDPHNDPNSSIIRILRNILYKLADGYVFQTKDAQQYYSPKMIRKSIIIGNPINMQLPLPYTGEREKRIVCVSRLAPQKNIKLLIDAFLQVKGDLDDYKLEIYGDGPLKDELSQYIIDKQVQEQVELMGFSKSIYMDIYKAAIFVIPSNYEGLSNSMLEALALGLPVIATDCPIGGARTYIKNKKNGILVQVGNVNQMSNALKELAEDEELRHRISNQSVEIRKILNEEVITDRWLNFINQMEL